MDLQGMSEFIAKNQHPLSLLGLEERLCILSILKQWRKKNGLFGYNHRNPSWSNVL